jgi:hypothetical protein
MSIVQRVVKRFRTAKSLVKPGDDKIMLDLSDLTDDDTPCSLAEFIKDNEKPGVARPDAQEMAELRHLRPGQEAHLSIGGGAVLVKRVK